MTYACKRDVLTMPVILIHGIVRVLCLSIPSSLCSVIGWSQWLGRFELSGEPKKGARIKAARSVCVGLHLFFVLGQYFRIVVIIRHTILATIAIAPLFVFFSNHNGHQQLQPAREATSAQASSNHPPPWARTLQVHVSFGVFFAIHVPEEGPPFARVPFGSLQN